MKNSRLNTLERQKPFTYRERKRIVTNMSRLLYQVNRSMIYLCEEFNKLSLVHFCESLEVFDPKKRWYPVTIIELSEKPIDTNIEEDWIESDKVCFECKNVLMWSTGWYDDTIEDGGACIGTLYECGDCGYFETY